MEQGGLIILYLQHLKDKPVATAKPYEHIAVRHVQLETVTHN
jgi:hypothetical protein